MVNECKLLFFKKNTFPRSQRHRWECLSQRSALRDADSGKGTFVLLSVSN